eukprot:6292953-Amphidinium_carterae.1
MLYLHRNIFRRLSGSTLVRPREGIGERVAHGLNVLCYKGLPAEIRKLKRELSDDNARATAVGGQERHHTECSGAV